MKPEPFESAVPSITVQHFDCHEGLGITIQEGGTSHTARLPIAEVVRSMKDAGERMRGKLGAEQLESLGTFFLALARAERAAA